MDISQLLVGNIAVASIAVKTIISAVKVVFPEFAENKKGIKLTAFGLGIIAAIISNSQLFIVEGQNFWMSASQNVFAGIFIGAASIGVHEVMKKMK